MKKSPDGKLIGREGASRADGDGSERAGESAQRGKSAAAGRQLGSPQAAPSVWVTFAFCLSLLRVSAADVGVFNRIGSLGISRPRAVTRTTGERRREEEGMCLQPRKLFAAE